MRNVFDQYSQAENRLTHALLASLDADRDLLRAFLNWIPCKTMPQGSIVVLEQSLPEEVEESSSEDEIEKRGLPDGWIHDKFGWSLLIESKVSSRPDTAQIERHARMALNRGSKDIVLLWLTVTPVKESLRPGVINRCWSDLYEWLSNGKHSEWARRAARYFEIAEVQADMKKQLREGTLTKFSGIPFGRDTAYQYSQAKRILGLLRDQLAKRADLKREVGADPNHKGRGAIKGTQDLAVWDFVALRDLKGSQFFTQHPHLTIGITNLQLEATVTFPNGIRSRLRTKMLGEDFESFHALVHETTNRIVHGLRDFEGAIPVVMLVQRRYLSMSSRPILDASMRFDPRTAFPVKGKRTKGSIRLQPEWLFAAFTALKHRRSNLQLSIGAVFPYEKCKKVGSAAIETGIANTWIACKPLIEAARETSK